MSIKITSKEPAIPQGYVVYRVHGEGCRLLKDFYDEVARVVHFPDYFGRNPDAFRDMLEDFGDYSEQRDGVVVISEAEHFLEAEIYRYRMLEDIVNAFKEASQYRVKEAGQENKAPRNLDLVFIIGESDEPEVSHYRARLQQMAA